MIPMVPMMKALMLKLAEHHATMARLHQNPEAFDHGAACASHLSAGEAIAECMKTVNAEFGKGFIGAGNELVPTKVSAILPAEAPPSPVRPVFRTGQREFSAEPTVDPLFKSLITID